MAIKNSSSAASLQWEQAFILRVKSGFEIPMDIDQYPCPSIWKRTDGPLKGVKDYYYVCINSTIARCFSQSTSTWHEVEQPPYFPQNFSNESARTPVKPLPIKPIEEEPIKEEPLMAFSSIETFFQ